MAVLPLPVACTMSVIIYYACKKISLAFSDIHKPNRPESQPHTMALVCEPALCVEGTNDFQVRRDIPPPQPAQNEVLVKVLYSGVNPADIKHSQLLGICDTVLGYDFCGEVLQARPGSGYAAGDIVAGYTPTSLGRPTRYGAFQAQLACPEDMMFHVPANLPKEDAAALTVVASTAADALFNQFGLPLPTEREGGGVDSVDTGPLLIWGASSSVGVCALQYAKAAGVRDIYVTASPSRHALLCSYGATQCFDYSQPDAVELIKAAVKGAGSAGLAYAFDAIGSQVSAQQTLLCAIDATRLASTTIQQDRRFQMPFAVANRPVEIHPTGMPRPITIPARPAAAARMWQALLWSIDEYGTSFRLPAVSVFVMSAEEAMGKVKEVAEKGSFGKVVLRLPFEKT
jgi:NADPH:quinone reductase-like Zn-dependent oxidoreductase